MNHQNKSKVRAWRNSDAGKRIKIELEETELQTVAIRKAIRRKFRLPQSTDAKAWGKRMGILRMIHVEIAPIIRKRRRAESNLMER